MAYRIQVISIYRPRVEQGNTVQKPELVAKWNDLHTDNPVT